MPTMQQFVNFTNMTPALFLSSPEKIINDAAKQNYGALKRCLFGRNIAEILQGGERIKEWLLLSATSTFQTYQPNDPFNYSNPQDGTKVELFWRFSRDHMTFVEQEVMLNAGEMSEGAMKRMWKKVRFAKEQRMWTSILGGLEDQFWQPAHVYTGGTDWYTQMESSSGQQPYSILAFVTEDTQAPGDNSGITYLNHPQGWTTLESVDPESNSNWRNKCRRYYAAQADTSTHINNLFNAFDRMWLDLQYVAPPTRQEYFENPTLNKQTIMTSKRGQALYKRALRNSNDQLVQKQDPAYNNPQYSGIDVEYVATLDTAANYRADADNDDSTFVAEDSSTLATNTGGTIWSQTDWTYGPRFYWLNFNYIKPFYHSEKFIKMDKAMNSREQPETYTQNVFCWHNNVCTSRRRQGIVGPGAQNTTEA